MRSRDAECRFEFTSAPSVTFFLPHVARIRSFVLSFQLFTAPVHSNGRTNVEHELLLVPPPSLVFFFSSLLSSSVRSSLSRHNYSTRTPSLLSNVAQYRSPLVQKYQLSCTRHLLMLPWGFPSHFPRFSFPLRLVLCLTYLPILSTTIQVSSLKYHRRAECADGYVPCRGR